MPGTDEAGSSGIKERVASQKVRDQVDTLATAIPHGEGTTAAS
jgi:hypothetical protein